MQNRWILAAILGHLAVYGMMLFVLLCPIFDTIMAPLKLTSLLEQGNLTRPARNILEEILASAENIHQINNTLVYVQPLITQTRFLLEVKLNTKVFTGAYNDYRYLETTTRKEKLAFYSMSFPNTSKSETPLTIESIGSWYDHPILSPDKFKAVKSKWRICSMVFILVCIYTLCAVLLCEPIGQFAGWGCLLLHVCVWALLAEYTWSSSCLESWYSVVDYYVEVGGILFLVFHVFIFPIRVMGLIETKAKPRRKSRFENGMAPRVQMEELVEMEEIVELEQNSAEQ